MTFDHLDFFPSKSDESVSRFLGELKNIIYAADADMQAHQACHGVQTTNAGERRWAQGVGDGAWSRVQKDADHQNPG